MIIQHGSNDQQALPLQLIANTPSRKNGIEEQTENMMRIFGCQLILDAGILIKLPQIVMARAQILFHRFYQKVSMRDHDVVLGSMSALLLSSKLEEVSKPIYDLIAAFKKLEDLPAAFSQMQDINIKAEIIRTERHILCELGFVLHTAQLPHTYIFFYLHILEGNDQLAQQTWNFCNDSLRSNLLCLHIKPQLVACGAIYMASKSLGIRLPENPPWWLLFEATKEDLDKISEVIESLYKQPKASYIPLSNYAIQALKQSSDDRIKANDDQSPSKPLRDSKEKYRDRDGRSSRHESRRDGDDRRRDYYDRHRSSHKSYRRRSRSRTPEKKRLRRDDR